MISDILSIGDKAEVKAVRRDGDVKEIKIDNRKLKSQVIDITGETDIKVTMPMEGGRIILLPLNGIFEMIFYTEKGLYRCFGRVVERNRSGNIYYLVVKLISALVKFQRREHYRFRCTINTYFRPLTEGESSREDLESLLMGIAEEMEAPVKKFEQGTIVDISGGGMNLVTDRQLEKGSLIAICFHIQQNFILREFHVIGRVLLSEETANRKSSFGNRIEFERIASDEREAIIRYIFEEERKIRKIEKS